MAFSQTYFQNAHNFEVHGGQFMNIANATIVNNGAHNDPVSTVLLQHIAHGAIFDSGERYPPGKCHPGTREKMIERILDWINEPTPPQHILWLYGPAGAGKSALAYTICEFIAQQRSEKYGVSFFFSRGKTDRAKGFKLFITLSYQLTVQIPSVRQEINEALRRDPSLPTKSMEVQFFSLIIQPLLRCQSLPSHSPTLIIDGLDECADDQGMNTQRNIIILISQSITRYNLPLRFMIASRPESWIRDTFETSALQSITLPLSLRDDEDADKDIKAYLTDEFEKIRVENQRKMRTVVPPWPPANIVDRFVYEASGQFIYASTLLKFVGQSSRFNDPQVNLAILTTPGPYRALAFSELDRLYERVISACPQVNWATMKRVLGAILAGVNSMVMELILRIKPAELSLVLDVLSPLIDIKHPKSPSEYELLLEPFFGSLSAGQDKISLCHLSFREFLEDETRSGAFHVHVDDIVQEISSAFFRIIHRNIDQNYAIEPNSSLGIGLATYQQIMSTMSWAIISNPNIDTQVTLINGMIHRLEQLDPDLGLNHIGCFIYDLHLIDMFLLRSPGRYTSDGPTNNQRFPREMVDKLNDAILMLKIIVFLTRRRCIRLWSSSNTFGVTPVLAYLNEVRYIGFPTIDELFTVPWYTVSDILSTFQQHRQIIEIHTYHTDLTYHLSLPDLSDNFEFEGDHSFEDDGWLTQNEWKDQRILLIIQFLNAYFDNSYEGKRKLIPLYLGGFFDTRNVSDINTREYLHNPSNLYFLTLMSDISVWTGRSPFIFSGVGFFILPVLRWFNRQLTNPETLRLLDDHDKSLVPKMATAMNGIFEHHFLSHYKIPYHTELYISTPSQEEDIDGKSIRITVLPLPHGWNQEEISYVPHVDITSGFLREFHDEVFRKREDGLPIIDREHWHPNLCSCLLNCLAKDLYRLINPEFKLFDEDSRDPLSKESFAYIVECLPFAETTRQNLDALRAIAYLFPYANLEWDLPIQFWDLSVDFLKKYDRSILSEEELSLFERWMYSMVVNNVQIMPHET